MLGNKRIYRFLINLIPSIKHLFSTIYLGDNGANYPRIGILFGKPNATSKRRAKINEPTKSNVLHLDSQPMPTIFTKTTSLIFARLTSLTPKLSGLNNEIHETNFSHSDSKST